MERIKYITFDKEAQDSLPQHIKDKMKADRDKARQELDEVKKLAILGVMSCCLDPNNRKFKNSENGIEWYCGECSTTIAH